MLTFFSYERRSEWPEADAQATLTSFIKRKFDPALFKVCAPRSGHCG